MQAPLLVIYLFVSPFLTHQYLTLHNRVIPKVRKTQHQNPEFSHTQDEIQKKNLRKSTLAFKGG
jgi:hypothetical protein